MNRAVSLCLLCLFLAGSNGCHRRPKMVLSEAEGVVMIDGQPLRNVRVQFIPIADDRIENIAWGDTDDAGHFVVSCKRGPGACVGKNIVVICEAPLPPHLLGEARGLQVAEFFKALGGRPIPLRYSDSTDNPLEVDVNPGQRTYSFELVRDEPIPR